MPLGEFVGQVIGEIVGQVVVQGFIKNLVFPVLRFPGAVLGWMIWRGRTFSMVWEKGNGFQQGVAGFVVHMSWIALVVVHHS